MLNVGSSAAEVKSKRQSQPKFFSLKWKGGSAQEEWPVRAIVKLNTNGLI